MSYEQTDTEARTDFAANLKARRSKERAEFEDAIEREELERQRKADEARMASVFAAQAEQNKLRVAIREAEKQEVIAGRKDPGFVLPEHMTNVRMSFENAKEFNNQQAERFRDSCEEFKRFNTPENCKLIVDYLRNQNVSIADVDTYQQAFGRLRDLGLLINEHTPEPASQQEPKPVAEVQPQQQPAPDPDKFIGTDGRAYTEREVYLMSAIDLKRIFGLYGPRLPKFADVIEQ